MCVCKCIVYGVPWYLRMIVYNYFCFYFYFIFSFKKWVQDFCCCLFTIWIIHQRKLSQQIKKKRNICQECLYHLAVIKLALVFSCTYQPHFFYQRCSIPCDLSKSTTKPIQIDDAHFFPLSFCCCRCCSPSPSLIHFSSNKFRTKNLSLWLCVTHCFTILSRMPEFPSILSMPFN